MKEQKLIKQIPLSESAKDELFDVLEDNDELMVEVLDLILDISERDFAFRERVLDKIFGTKYLARNVENEMHKEEEVHGCCKGLIAR